MAIDRHHRAYKEKRIAAKRAFARQNAECGICRGKLGPIDYEASAGQPLSFDLDHIVSLANGGMLMDMKNWQASHATCNRRKGIGSGPKTQQRPPLIRRATRW